MKMLKTVYKVCSNMLFVLVIVSFVAVAAVTVLSGVNMQQDRLLFGSFGFGHVVTGSMEPDIPTGSFILIRQVDESDLKIGDVILFRSDDPLVPENTPVSHQIIRSETDEFGDTFYVTKGTANDIEDSDPVYYEDIIGRVSYSSVWIGKLIDLAQKPIIYPILILLLFISMLQSVFDVIKQFIALNKQSKDTE